MVLELRDDDDVARTEVVEPPRVGDQVDRLRRARVNTISFSDGALRRPATVRRAPSKPSVARSASR